MAVIRVTEYLVSPKHEVGIRVVRSDRANATERSQH